MSTESELNKASYVASGNSTYPIPFQFTDNSHIKLYIDNASKVLNTHYSVGGANNPSGGTLTIIGTPPDSGEEVVILREVPIKQPNSFAEGGPFLAKTIEGMFDRLTFISQQLKEELQRAVRFPVSSTKDPQINGTVAPGAVLVVNPTGNGLDMGPVLADYNADLDAKVASALNSKNAAETAATSAVTSANTATTKATEASDSAASAANSANEAAVGTGGIGAPQGTRETGLLLSSSSQIIPVPNKAIQTIFVRGNGGPVTITSIMPLDVAGMIIGQIIHIAGTSDSAPVTLNSGNNFYLNGEAVLGKDDILSMLFLGSDGASLAYVEIGRNI